MPPKSNLNFSMSEETTTVRYSDADLQEFKVLIEGKLDKAKVELDYLEEQIQDLTESSNDNQSGDWFDDSSLHTDIEMLSNMATRQRQFIDALEAAMVRVKNKTYGICTVTGKLIDKKRLLVVPHATKSLEAKEIEKTQPEPKPAKAIVAPAPPKKEEAQAKPEKKIITKVIKRSGTKPAPVKPIDEDEDFEFDTSGPSFDEEFEDDMETDNDVDIDNIPDDEPYDDDND